MRRMEELNTCMWDTFTYPNRFQIKFIAAFTKQAAQIVLEIRSDFTAIKRHSADGTAEKIQVLHKEPPKAQNNFISSSTWLQAIAGISKAR